MATTPRDAPDTPAPAEALDSLRIKRASTAEQVADALREMIMRGEVEPGTPLREVPMAASIGVSRNTMREAIRMLVREGLVTHHMHRGAIVTRLSERDVADLFRVRRALELSAIGASGEATPEQLRGLEETVEQLGSAAEADAWEQLIEADRLFHERLVGFLGSRRLDRFFETIQAELRLCLSIVDRQDADPQELLAEHRELYDLMASDQQARCVERMTEHLADAEKRLRLIVRGWDDREERR